MAACAAGGLWRWLSLAALTGKIAVLHAFQMLCPGCVTHGVPQTKKLHRMMHSNGDAALIGLHTVFEHHAAMTPVSLEAFIHEYPLTLPIGVDQAGDGTPLPVAMLRYGMRGTPSTIIIDRLGRIRHHSFGQDDDLALGLRLGALLAEPAIEHVIEQSENCATGACYAPEKIR